VVIVLLWESLSATTAYKARAFLMVDNIPNISPKAVSHIAYQFTVAVRTFVLKEKEAICWFKLKQENISLISDCIEVNGSSYFNLEIITSTSNPCGKVVSQMVLFYSSC
jgi:hypothetical protein